jgi:polar amino acid transport system substrate-binding protein
MSVHPPRWLVTGLILWAAVALAGCASVSDRAQNSSLVALATQEPRPGDELPALQPTPDCLAHPFRSLRPSVLPRPRHMPAGSLMHRILKRGHLVVGVDQNTLRLGYFNPATSRMEGLDIDLARAVARAILGNHPDIRYKAISTKQRETVIATSRTRDGKKVHGEVDLVASAYSITCKRRRRMLFSSVYYTARQRLLVPENDQAFTLSDLDGKKVCATEGSTSLDRLSVNRDRTGVIPQPVPLRPDCLVALQEGEVAAISSDDAILFGFCRQDPQTKIVGLSLNVERYGMAINPDYPEFVKFVNAVLGRLRRSGDLRTLRQRWFQGLTARVHGGSRPQCARDRT